MDRTLLVLFIFVISFFVVGFFASCSKKTFTNTSQTKDSIHIEYKERLVEVPVPGDTVEVEKLIECDSLTNKPKPFTVKMKSGRARINLKVDSKGSLTATGICDSLTRIVKLADKEIFRLREKIEKLEVLKTEYKTRTIDKIARWFMLVALLTGGGLIVLKLKGWL